MDKKILFNFRTPSTVTSEMINYEESSEKTPEYFASELMQARTQFHIWHLQATSYEIHVAIDMFYSSLSGIIDKFVETVQGKNKFIIKGYTTQPLTDFISKEQILTELEEFKQDVLNYMATFDKSWSNVENQLQELLDTIEHCIYRLTFLN